MKKSKAIHHAVERLSTPTLPYGFNARLMARIRERAREQRRTDIITGIVASVAIIAMVAYGVFAMAQVEFPHLDWGVMFDEVMMARMRLWGMMTLSVVAMVVVDMYIRQYFRLRKMRRKDEKKR
ncbi:MAG: hypothetical protein IKV12_05710 [Alistipes sp.]|nr:hypothetical protein [Alistipes sp.]